MAVTTLDNHLHRFCGGRYQAADETVTVRLSGMQAQVTRGLFRCAKCGDEQRTVEQREAAERDAVERMRGAHALLAPREIRQLREGLGLTPAQLGELLYGVPRGVVEGWERGRYLQNREADALLRSLRDRDTLERRAARAGVVLPTPGAPAGEGATPPAAAAATAADPAAAR
jgi:DNA-binding transcriptional regulator YiaG